MVGALAERSYMTGSRNFSLTKTYVQAQVEHVASRESEEVQNLEYGAFFQVIQKIGDNIDFITYAMPRGITHEMMRRMSVETLYPEKHFQGDIMPQTFENGDLSMLVRSGVHLGTLDCMLTVAQKIIVAEHKDFDSVSMKKYAQNYPKMVAELPTVKARFLANLFAAKPEAEVANGIHIYHGAYEYKPETGKVIGWNLDKTKQFDIADLARDIGHKEQLAALVQALQQQENVTVVLTDQSGSVADCAASCSKFFELKEKLGFTIQSAVDVIKQYFPSFQASYLLPLLFSQERSAKQCQQCKEKESVCQCASNEVATGQ